VNWKKYKLTPTDGSALSCVIEAPSIGIAVEHYLAVHGMFGYDGFIVEEVEGEEPDERAEAVKESFETYKLTKAFIDKLDEWHMPNCEVVKRGEKVRKRN